MKQAGKWMAGICLIMIMAFLIPVTGFPWPVPDTGQANCYNNTEEIPCPSTGEDFYGQDASYTINPMSYTKLDAAGNDLSDSAASWAMVRDNVTGLIWEVKHSKNDIPNYANPHDADNIYTWYDSNPATNGGDPGEQGNGTSTFDTEQYINALNTENYGVHNDWRLPTMKELSFIVDYSSPYPGATIDGNFFPNTWIYWYWSSTTRASSTDYAWAVLFGGGDGYGSKGTSRYVRAVRGGQSDALNPLVLNDNGTVTDTNTGLTWQQETAPGIYNWQAALVYCENLPLAGFNDWRLPTVKELRSIIDFTRNRPSINTDVFTNTSSHLRYWSSTSRRDSINAAWSMDFDNDGYCYSDGKYNNNPVRAVRGGQSDSLDDLVISGPAPGSQWQVGDSLPIAWNPGNISGNITLSISRQGGAIGAFIPLATTENDGIYDWTVTGPASINCVIKIEQADNPANWKSGGVFVIHSDIQIERQALIELYKSTDGDNWTNNSGWKEPPLDVDGFAMPGTEGGWHGITVVDDTVIGIYLSSNNLVGEIPPEIGNLTHLTGLSLDINQLSGTMPTEIGNLTQLTLLRLGGNQLSGAIPTEIGNLTQLTKLYLNSNQLSRTIPSEIWNLTQLTSLSLYRNQLSGTIPPEIGNLTQLTYLYLSSNQLSGTIPSEIGNLTQLTYLSLYSNQLTGTIPPEIGNLTQLTKLILDINQLSGTIPPEIGNLTQLTTLSLQINQLSGTMPTEIGNLTQLTFLRLGANQLSGAIPPEIGNLTQLTGLYLSNNQLSGTIPPEIGNLTQLTELSLWSNQLRGPLPKSLENLTELRDGEPDFRWNALYTADDDLRTFINQKQDAGNDWESTQTIAPENPAVTGWLNGEVTISWDPIIYVYDTGGYIIEYAEAPIGPWTVGEMSADKSATTLNQGGLDPNKNYYFKVRTLTYAHANNQNDVYSEYTDVFTMSGDSDDDGIPDNIEDGNGNGVVDPGETDPNNPDTDGDGIQDGTEKGLTLSDIGPDTDTGLFIPDNQSSTTTNPLLADTDSDGFSDGEEDPNHNGQVDVGESDSNDEYSVPVPYGDISGDGACDLSDAVLALQISVGIPPAQAIYKATDVNGDKKIGIGEAIYVLEKVAGQSMGRKNLLRVPAAYQTIQEAIDASSDGDMIVVSDGTYTGAGNRDIDFKGKSILVRSLNGPEFTIIDCQASVSEKHRGFYFHSGETAASIIEGFTITNGYGPIEPFSGSEFSVGGGIYCIDSSSPLIQNNIIINNSANNGGGIQTWNHASPTISNNTIKNNTAFDGGGGINCYMNCSSLIYKNVISKNEARRGAGLEINASFDSGIRIENNIISANYATWQGGGIYCGNTTPYFVNNTIAENSCDTEGGGVYFWAAYPIISNTILWNNQGGEIALGSNSSVTITYSNISGGYLGEGNIDSDPLFVDTNNYHLSSQSPCIDSGSPIYAPNTDIDVDLRPQAGGYDIGADEYK